MLALNLFRKLQGTLNKRLLLFKDKLKLPEKYKGGRIERWAQFWKILFEDYKIVAQDVINESKSRPIKTLMIIAGIGTTIYAIETNPDEITFRNQLLNHTNDLMILSDDVRNPEAADHMKFLCTCSNEGLLRRMNLGILSVIWIDNYHPNCQIYQSQCSYLKPEYLTFYERIIDIGIFGEFIRMKMKMKDFDINPEEWKNIQQ